MIGPADLDNLFAEAEAAAVVAAGLDILYIEVGDQLRSQYFAVHFRTASDHCSHRPDMTMNLRTSSMLALVYVVKR